MNNKHSDEMSQRNSDIRVGLALSGGGFRASFFHIGVLAALAETGILHNIEIISTVSGGSIIGALYYLRLKDLLESSPDRNITSANYKKKIDNADYVEIISELETHFFNAVKKNIRMRTFSNILSNLKMARPNYSRSDRIGELYEEHIYKNSFKLADLKIQPFEVQGEFNPTRDNKNRGDKIPILLINATTLNTGHNWRFEAVRMGEPESNKQLQLEIDKNLRLLRPDKWIQLTRKQSEFKLGHAVAASACVPAVFHPLAISDMYEPIENSENGENIRVQLVDGGVHDNIGIMGLLDRQCSHYIVSDASGQLTDEADPSTNIFSVINRTSSILMDRAREEEMYRLHEQFKDRIAFMHLRKGILPKVARWRKREGGSWNKYSSATQLRFQLKQFGVPPELQFLLSNIRTDLDSFTEIEAYSLMLDGYLMSKFELKNRIGEFEKFGETIEKPSKHKWQFLKIQPWFDKPEEKFYKSLNVGRLKAFKVFYLRPSLAFPLLIVTAAVVGFLLWLLLGFGLSLFQKDWKWISNKIEDFLSITVADLLMWVVIPAILGLIIGILPKLARIFKILYKLRSRVEVITHILTRAVLPALGAVFVWLHLNTFDLLFFWAGKIDRLDASNHSIPNPENETD